MKLTETYIGEISDSEACAAFPQFEQIQEGDHGTIRVKIGPRGVEAEATLEIRRARGRRLACWLRWRSDGGKRRLADAGPQPA